MFDTIFGLPLHPLLVHATVVVVPVAAITVALAALWPKFRSWAAFMPLGLSTLALILVPLSTSSGESLEKRVQQTALMERHTQIAEGLLPWVIVLFVAALALAAYERFGRADGVSTTPRWVVAGVVVIALAGSIGTAVQVGRIGHSGAKASWSDAASPQKR